MEKINIGIEYMIQYNKNNSEKCIWDNKLQIINCG
jgi:hypothetical protein